MNKGLRLADRETTDRLSRALHSIGPEEATCIAVGNVRVLRCFRQPCPTVAGQIARSRARIPKVQSPATSAPKTP